jgi:hypothetical protein
MVWSVNNLRCGTAVALVHQGFNVSRRNRGFHNYIAFCTFCTRLLAFRDLKL